MSCDQSYSDFTGWDFEDGTMGSWEVTSEYESYKWNIIFARTSRYDNFSIEYDHTTRTEGGKLAEATGIVKGLQVVAPNGTRTTLTSTKVKNSDAKTSFYCLSFWFWRRKGHDQLEIIQEIHDNNDRV